MRSSPIRCLHCKNVSAWNAGRGLCGTCYKNKTIREQYPRQLRVFKDPTMAQLDALVTKQMQNLPKWWKDESQKHERTIDKRPAEQPSRLEILAVEISKLKRRRKRAPA